MKCWFCNNEINEGDSYCPRCGRAQQPQSVYTAVPVRMETNGYAVAGFILAFFIPILGLIFSVIGRLKAKKTDTGKGLAIAGIIISIVEIALAMLLSEAIIALISSPTYYF